MPSFGAPDAAPQPPVVFAQFGGRIAPGWTLADTLSYAAADDQEARHETRRETAVAVVVMRGSVCADARGNQRQCEDGNGTIAQRGGFADKARFGMDKAPYDIE